MQTNALLSEAKTLIDRLTALAEQICAAGLANEVADLITAETEADRENAAALLTTETNPLNKQEYEQMVAELGRIPTLDMQAFINYDLRSAFATALQTLQQQS